MTRIRAVARKEFLQIFRDRRTLILITLMPFIQLTIYGYAINTDVKHLATALYDEDQTPMSRRLVATFEQSAYFDVTLRVQSPRALRRALDLGRVKAGLHIPTHFAQDLTAGRGAPLQLLIDGTDSNPANAALNTGQAIIANFVQQEGFVTVSGRPIDYRPRMWYNPDLKSAFFMVPGLVGLLLQLLIPMITATAVVREKERGNIEQLLVTPIKPYELIIGKLLPYMAIGMVIATLVVGAAWLLFHVPVRGNPITLLGLTLLFLTVCLGLGLFASTVAENQQQAAQIIMLFAAPSILLSGFIFPREAMPLPIFYLGNLIPLTYFLKIVRGVILKGLGVMDLWPQILPLGLMAIGILTVSILKFHKRLA
ncbi:MAG: ABC transporter permease [Candidatus Omnitrophica bacterium]|nr:ABC transporter permease [Candidatus Omnitrophota bacterium]